MNKKINVFVYGSLREGFFNYDKYLKGKVISIKPGKIHN
ncbi:gamma-glutamylcyclotransferase, partial [Clostridium butyricum]